MLVSSKADSTSSKTQNGAGLNLKIANNKAIAVNDLHPDNKLKFCNLLPGG